MLRWWWLVVVCGALLGIRSPAHAQAVVVMAPPALAEGTDARKAEDALDALAVALRESRYKVVTHGQAASAIAALADEKDGFGSSPHECTSRDCAARFRAFFDAGLGLRFAVEDGDGAQRVTVTLLTDAETYWSGQARVREGDLQQAARRALDVAQRRYVEREGPWLTVEGAPQGADVFVDGEHVGALPYDAALPAGEHHVEVRTAGMQPQERQVRLASEPRAEAFVEMVLEEQPAEPAAVTLSVPNEREEPSGVLDASPLERPTSAYDWALGGAMMAAGATVGLVGPVMTATRDGQCTNGERDLMDCPHTYEFNKGVVWGQLVSGAALLAGGVAVMATKPIRLMLTGDTRSAHIRVRGRF